MTDKEKDLQQQLVEIESFAELKPGWFGGEESSPISLELITLGQKILYALDKNEIEIPRVRASPDGSIDFTWIKNLLYCTLETDKNFTLCSPIQSIEKLGSYALNFNDEAIGYETDDQLIQKIIEQVSNKLFKK